MGYKIDGSGSENWLVYDSVLLAVFYNYLKVLIGFFLEARGIRSELSTERILMGYENLRQCIVTRGKK